MGRYPLRTTLREWIDAMKDYYAPSTLAYTTSILKVIEREFSIAKKGNPDLKGEPANWGENEVKAVILAIRRSDLSHNSQVQYLTALRGLLRFVGNGTMDKMKARYPTMFPRTETERKPSLTEDQLSLVLRATDQVEGWRGECMRFAFWTYAYTGIRLSELTLAEESDLDTQAWTLRVSHPKGERNYGMHRVLPIPEPLRPIVSRFLREREKELARLVMLQAKPLMFPKGDPSKAVSKNTVQLWKSEVSKISGTSFTVHSLRRTYGQNLLNRGVQLPTVSLMLGHSSTITTEKHYCRKDPDSARLEVIQAFAESRTVPSVNPPMIDRKESLPGYV